ncbi:MAG TPA: glycosyl hydrolase family 28 protein [Acidobacteriaceae bacterium]|nr:glycosyl hydrolase family 28 protein [Acidobacteriaceae bacterium]
MLQKALASPVCGIVLFAIVSIAHAQDTRSVTEPKIPATCIKLEAKLSATGDALAGATLTEADENSPDTERIQQAIDSIGSKCKAGEAIELAPGKSRSANAFLSGPLELRDGVTLLIDKGITLFASRRAADYDISGPGTCGTMPAKGRCKPFISVRANNVGIMGDGVIDGRGGAKLLDKNYSWWALAVKAEPGNVPYSDPRLIDAAAADGFTLYRITLHDSPNFHVGVNRTNGFTAWGVHLKTPVHQLGPNDPRPRNTDGIDPGSSSNVTIAHSWIDNGDDNVAIKTGVTHISVLDNHFYSGHGMSIGSETYTGDSYLLVDGLTEDHTTSGIRIKSNVTRGGLVHDLIYRNICMRDVQVPIAISPYYNNGTTDQFFDPGLKGDRIPEYKNISIENVTDLTPGDILIAGHDEAHRTQVNFKNVNIAGLTPDKLHLKFADIGVTGTNIPFARATDKAEIKLVEGKNETAPYSCQGKFVPMR